MNYELALKLKEAGFPKDWGISGDYKFPTLSELIEACGERFNALERNWDNKTWCVTAHPTTGYNHFGQTPEIAVANLWLELNKK